MKLTVLDVGYARFKSHTEIHKKETYCPKAAIFISSWEEEV